MKTWEIINIINASIKSVISKFGYYITPYTYAWQCLTCLYDYFRLFVIFLITAINASQRSHENRQYFWFYFCHLESLHFIILLAKAQGKYGGPESCASRLCKCDQAFAECLRRFPCPSQRRVCRSAPLRYLQNIFMTVT